MIRRAILTMLTIGALAVAGVASAGNVVLDHDGSLYRLVFDGESLVLQITSEPNAETEAMPVPQTNRILARNLNVDVDPASHTAVLAWQQVSSSGASRVLLATYLDGTWFGPVVIAGESGETASNPALLVNRVTSTASDGTEVSDTFIQLAWWQGDGSDGSATYAGVRLDPTGIPELDEFAPQPLSGLLPYGVSCTVDDEQQVLEHPKFFVDPETGDPHLLFADLRDCLFAFLQISTELQGDGPDATSQRRRNVIVFGVRESMSLEPHLELANAKVEVGHGLSVVLYWDTESGIRYINMNQDGWSAPKTLTLDGSLTHEQAVDLIRGLTR